MSAIENRRIARNRRRIAWSARFGVVFKVSSPQPMPTVKTKAGRSVGSLPGLPKDPDQKIGDSQ